MTTPVQPVAGQAPADTIIRPASWMDPMPLASLFSLQQPIQADIGCGKGAFLLASAKANPGINYLGIDRMLRRIRKVNRKAVREGLANIRLLRAEASYAIRYLVPANTLSAAYIFFPDPWPKRRHHKHRLFTPQFLDTLHATLRSAAPVHVSTDNMQYAEAIQRLLKADPRFEEIPVPAEVDAMKTDFEKEYLLLNLPIWKRSFRKKELGPGREGPLPANRQAEPQPHPWNDAPSR